MWRGRVGRERYVASGWVARCSTKGAEKGNGSSIFAGWVERTLLCERRMELFALDCAVVVGVVV